MHNFYDGIDYHYSSSDIDRSKGIEIITNILGAPPNLDGLEYSLKLYAGGTGVNDYVGFRFKYEPASWPIICQKLRLKSPGEAINSSDWLESFEWLIRGNKPANDLASDVQQFIEQRKLPFQDSILDSTTVVFSNESDVNSWCVIWKTGNWVNYLSFDQG